MFTKTYELISKHSDTPKAKTVKIIIDTQYYTILSYIYLYSSRILQSWRPITSSNMNIYVIFRKVQGLTTIVPE